MAGRARPSTSTCGSRRPPENAARVMRPLRDFGAPLGDLMESDLAKPGTGFKMGEPPSRIDVLTRIEGVRFEDAWPRRLETAFGSVSCAVIGREDLLVNKRAAGRPQDLAHVSALAAAAAGQERALNQREAGSGSLRVGASS